MRRLLIALFLLFVSFSPAALAGEAASALYMDDFARIPVVHEGRVKPLDSYARVHLLGFYHKDKLPDMSASSWLAELLFDQETAYQRPVFNIPNPDLLHAIGLEYRLPHYYSFAELGPALAEHVDLFVELSKTPKQDLSVAQEQLAELFDVVNLYYDISRSFLPPVEEGGWAPVLPSVGFRIIPSPWDKDQGNWFSPWELEQKGSASPQTVEYIKIWSAMALAYNAGEPRLWNEAAAAARRYAGKIAPQDSIRSKALSAELYYNKLDLFRYSQIFYIASFLSLLMAGMAKPSLMRKTAFGLLGAGAVIHLSGIVLRVYVMARPPVGTLYESIIFVGLVVVLFSMVLESKNRDGLGILIGAVVGTVLHFIGMRYAADGDSLNMLSAVLNTNFWLATHVVMITIGYGACLVAGVLAHLYLLLRAFHPDEREKLGSLARNMLSAGLIALFFCVLGTILGGIWADQSWGRFWGWDPKENGAMLICLWLIAMVHGRIAGLLRAVTFAMGMAFTVVIVALAWFGVNLLSVGLHSYGFTENIATNLFLFVSGEVLFLTFVAVAFQRHKVKKEKP